MVSKLISSTYAKVLLIAFCLLVFLRRHFRANDEFRTPAPHHIVRKPAARAIAFRQL